MAEAAQAAVRKFSSGTMVLSGDRNALLPAQLTMRGDFRVEVALCEGR